LKAAESFSVLKDKPAEIH